MTNALRQALTDHRAQCPDCTPHRACGQYLGITRQHTEARQIRAGTTAPHVVLSVREAR